jgi:hypothetical protein
LKVEKTVQFIDEIEIRVQIYNKIEEENKIKWIFDEHSEDVTIKNKFVF